MIAGGGDTCETATAITALPFADDGVTWSSADNYDWPCPNASSAPDVVYRFTPDHDMAVFVSLCRGSQYDTKLFIYANTCAGTPADCNDDACTSPGLYWTAIISRTITHLTAGNTYYIVVDGTAGWGSGYYTLDVSEVVDTDGDGVFDPLDNCLTLQNPDQADADSDGAGDACDNCPGTSNPDQADWDGNGVGDMCELGGGDTCENALQVTMLPFAAAGTTCLAGDDYHDGCGAEGGGPDVVYQFTPVRDMYVQAALCRGSDYDTRLFVYAGSCATSPVDCNDDTCASPTNSWTWLSRTITHLSAGTTYYFVVDGSGCGYYTIDLTEVFDADGDGVFDAYDNCPTVRNADQTDSDSDGIGDACDNCPSHPNSDQADWNGNGMGDRCDMGGGETCETALQIAALPFASAGSTCVANDDYHQVCDYDGPGGRDVVYRFTPSLDMTANISLCRNSDYDTQLYVYLDTCTGAAAACNEDSCSTPRFSGPYVSRLTMRLAAGHTYYLVVDGYADPWTPGCGEYTLDVTQEPDADGDGISDGEDNCPAVSNSDQRDGDRDGEGDVCDDDIDSDGVANAEDNCPRIRNSDQIDSDSNGVGDACEGDTCEIAVAIASLPYTVTGSTSHFIDDYDAPCPEPGTSPDVVYRFTAPRDMQVEIAIRAVVWWWDAKVEVFAGSCTGPAIACMTGMSTMPLSLSTGLTYYVVVDGDEEDAGAYTLQVYEPIDTDGDGLYDALDNCPRAGNSNQEDGDDDGVGDACDNCPTVWNPDQADGNGNGVGNACEIGGGDTCETAVEITTIPYSGGGNTCTANNNYSACGWSIHGSPDVVYRFSPPDDMTLKISLCGNSAFDTILYVLEDMCDSQYWIACNDDRCDSPRYMGGGHVSALSARFRAGHLYYIIVDGSNGGCGDFTIDITPGIDADQDGAVDEYDNCATIANPGQDDWDRDGVGDVCDQCPGSVEGIPVGPDGCVLNPIRYDFDRDGDVDGTDYARFLQCSSGPNVPIRPTSCSIEAFTACDRDTDGDVDGDDFGGFQRCYSGQETYALPECLN